MGRISKALDKLRTKCTEAGTHPAGKGTADILECIAEHFEAGSETKIHYVDFTVSTSYDSVSCDMDASEVGSLMQTMDEHNFVVARIRQYVEFTQSYATIAVSMYDNGGYLFNVPSFSGTTTYEIRWDLNAWNIVQVSGATTKVMNLHWASGSVTYNMTPQEYFTDVFVRGINVVATLNERMPMQVAMSVEGQSGKRVAKLYVADVGTDESVTGRFVKIGQGGMYFTGREDATEWTVVMPG